MFGKKNENNSQPVEDNTCGLFVALFNGQETDMFASAFSDDYDVPLDGWMD